MVDNALNRRLRDYAFSGRAQTADIPFLYGLRDGQGGPQPLDALGGSAGDASRGGDLPSLVGQSAPVSVSGPADTGLVGPGLEGDNVNFLSGFLNTGTDPVRYDNGSLYDNGDGGRGQDGPADTGFSAVGPLDGLNSDILSAIGNVPGFGLATGLRRGLDFLGIPAVNTPASFGLPGTDEFAENIEKYRTQRQLSRERFANRLDNDAEVDGDFGFGAPTDPGFGLQDNDVFGADPSAPDVSNDLDTSAQPAGGFSVGAPDSSFDGGGRGQESGFSGGSSTDSFDSPNQDPGDDDLGSRDDGPGDGGGGNDGGGGGNSGGVGCFVAGTPILLADGSQKPIEHVSEGDLVTSFNGMGDLESKRVTHTMRFEDKPTLRVRIKQPKDKPVKEIVCTSEHPFLRPNGAFTPIGEMKPGEHVVQGDKLIRKLLSIDETGEPGTVYNFEVEDNHTYVANGFRVHNIKHEGGVVTDYDDVPGEEVTQKTLEGEVVMSRAAVDMFGADFLTKLNELANMAYRKQTGKSPAQAPDPTNGGRNY